MAKATDQSKAGSVTVATVRAREEAQRIASKLEAAGIACFLTVERTLVQPTKGHRFKEIKVQVSRADAMRAVQLLRDKDDGTGARPRTDEVVAQRSGSWLGGRDWRRAAISLIAMVGLAALLAAWLF